MGNHIEGHGEYLSANIELYYCGRGAEERVDAPLIDLHKIAVSWLRFSALRTDKNAGGWHETWRGEKRCAVCRYESRYAV